MYIAEDNYRIDLPTTSPRLAPDITDIRTSTVTNFSSPANNAGTNNLLFLFAIANDTYEIGYCHIRIRYRADPLAFQLSTILISINSAAISQN